MWELTWLLRNIRVHIKNIPLSFLFEKKALYPKGISNRKLIKICKLILQERYRLIVDCIKIKTKIVTCENSLIDTGWIRTMEFYSTIWKAAIPQFERQRSYRLDHFRLQILKVKTLLSIYQFFTSSYLIQEYLNISLVWRERMDNVFKVGGKSWSTFLSNSLLYKT